MTTDRTLLDRHLADLRSGKYSESTIRERERAVLALPHPTNLERLELQEWWRSRENKDNGDARSRAGRASEQSHLREFWRWCRMEGELDHNPSDWLPRVRQTHTKAVVVQEGDLYQIFQEAPDDMRRMIALGGMAGLRSSEIAAITWEDMDPANGVLWVRGGKGGKDRSVPLSTGLLIELGTPETGPIVGRKMTGKAVSAQIGRYMRSKGVDLSAHKLRARYITRFIMATGDAVAAAEVAGHAGVGTIMRYAVASSDTMRRGAEAAGRIG